MPSSFVIREGEARDIPAISLLLDALNHTEGYDVQTDANRLGAALQHPAQGVSLTALVAESTEGVMGVLLCYPGYDTLSASYGYHLADMVVAPSQRRQGVGRQLVKALASRALAEGKQWISLTALSHNAAARAFYLSLGMTQVEVDFFAMGQGRLKQL